jgi:TatD DNase family protein
MTAAKPIRKREASKGRNLEHPPAPEPLTIGVFDNHTHLEFEDGIETLLPEVSLKLAQEAGVRGVVQVGTDLATSRWGVELARNDSRVKAAIALHPNEAPRLASEGLLDEQLEAIAELASDPVVCAIGETGLDFFRTGEEGRDAQFASFEAHIGIAKANNIALQIHDRDAHEAVFETLARVGAPERTVLHCFSGDLAFAKRCLERGWYLSFAGTVTFKSAHALREALTFAPRDQILVETDAPFLTPEPFRGRPNAPYLIPNTVRMMAEHRGDDLDVLCEALAANSESVYGSWSAGV